MAAACVSSEHKCGLALVLACTCRELQLGLGAKPAEADVLQVSALCRACRSTGQRHAARKAETLAYARWARIRRLGRGRNLLPLRRPAAAQATSAASAQSVARARAARRGRGASTGSSSALFWRGSRAACVLLRGRGCLGRCSCGPPRWRVSTAVRRQQRAYAPASSAPPGRLAGVSRAAPLPPAAPPSSGFLGGAGGRAPPGFAKKFLDGAARSSAPARVSGARVRRRCVASAPNVHRLLPRSARASAHTLARPRRGCGARVARTRARTRRHR